MEEFSSNRTFIWRWLEGRWYSILNRMKQHDAQVGRFADTGNNHSETRSGFSRYGTGSALPLFGALLALILGASPLLADEPSKFVVFDNDFFGPAGSDLQAAALLLTDPNAKVLG